MPGRLLALVLAALLVPAVATAAAPTPPTTSTATTPAAAPTPTTSGAPTTPSPPAPVARKGSLTLYLPGQYVVSRQIVTVPGRAVRVNGVVRPYVAGQRVTVRVLIGRRVIKTGRLRIKSAAHNYYGRFSFLISSPLAGSVTIEVRHAGDAEQKGFSARRSFAALDTNIGFGATGRFVELVQQRLAALHIYIPQTGVYDQGTGLALDAYHRLLGWGTYQDLDHATVTWLLNGWGAFAVHDPGDGVHAEGNLTHQLLALLDGSKVRYIFPISSGKPSTPTVLGHFRVYSRVPGYLPDGMYYSDFFYGGYAIHGYDPAPDYPASHGCMRLPIVDAIFVYDWLNFGDAVDVYY